MNKDKLLKLLKRMEENAYHVSKCFDNPEEQDMCRLLRAEVRTLETVRCILTDSEYAEALWNLYMSQE